MIKIDIYSDLHVDAWRHEIQFAITNDSKYALAIVAGDSGNGLHFQTKIKNELEKHYKKVFIIPGNHDYYGETFEDCQNEKLQELEFDGFKIVGCTYWTNFRKNVFAAQDAYRYINDFVYIKDITPAKIIQLHNKFKKNIFDLQYKPDIIVTHFPPIIESQHEKYGEHILNPYFVNDDEEFFLHMSPKIWIHGHTHSAFDYTKGETRVICNPMGYPNENTGLPLAIPKSIELNAKI